MTPTNILILIAVAIWSFLLGAFIESRFNKRDTLKLIKELKEGVIWEK